MLRRGGITEIARYCAHVDLNKLGPLKKMYSNTVDLWLHRDSVILKQTQYFGSGSATAYFGQVNN